MTNSLRPFVVRSYAALALTLTCVLFAASADAATFAVTNSGNAGAGSLRQAILDSNATPGPHVIEIDLPATAPAVIAPSGQFLPPLKGPVVVRVKGGAPRAAVILDGSSLVKPRTPEDCPGATAAYNATTNAWENTRVMGTGPNVRGYYGAGLAVHDSADVDISGLDIRNFCIGIAVVRSHGVRLHDLRISESHGAAGVIFTGDDGNGMVTASSYDNTLSNSVLLDNGDGFEYTRGTHDSVLQGNTIALTRPLPANGNAVEFATSGDRNAVIGNTFTRYVETAVTVGGAGHTIRGNHFVSNEGAGMRANGANLLIAGNAFTGNGGDAMSVGGAGTRVIDNLISANRGRGVVVASLGVTVARNAIHGNGRLGIDAEAPAGRRGGGAGPGAGPGAPGAATPAPAAAAPSAPEPLALPAPPVVAATSRWSPAGVVIQGSLAGKPGERYVVHVYGSREADRHTGDDRGWGEGEAYLGSATVQANPSGSATFALTLGVADLFSDGRTSAFFAATATDAGGTTSKFSRALPLSHTAP